MSKNVKQDRESAGGDSALSKKVKDSAKDIWLAGLGAFAKSESKEDSGMFSSLVSDGKHLEQATRKQIDKQINHVKDAAMGKVDEIKGRAVDSFYKLEKAFDERVSSALSRLHMPTKEDVELLNQKVEALTKIVAKLEKKQSAKTNATSARKKTASTATSSSSKTAKSGLKKAAAKKKTAASRGALKKASVKKTSAKKTGASKSSVKKSAVKKALPKKTKTSRK